MCKMSQMYTSLILTLCTLSVLILYFEVEVLQNDFINTQTSFNKVAYSEKKYFKYDSRETTELADSVDEKEYEQETSSTTLRSMSTDALPGIGLDRHFK